MQIHLQTLGCRLNEAELESWAEGFQSRGHHVVNQPEKADMLVVNTCAVTQEAVKKSRQMIRRTHRENPTAKLVVSGCYASLTPSLQQDIDSIDLLVNNRNKDQLVDIALRELDTTSMPSISTTPGEAAIFKRGRNRAFIKVQDGCRYRCTFCIVTVARGEERSREAKAVIEEINRMHEHGIQEAVLTGVHLGGYGSDIDSNLVQLLEDVLENTDIPRIRLGSLEPWELTDDFFALFSNKRLMPHLHLPLQSGCDSVLKRMARRCKTEDYSSLVSQARELIHDFNLTTDIIVGFPGETESEWQTSIEYIEKTGFSHIHIFSYSPREGTKAATLKDIVDVDTRKARSRDLHILADRLRDDFLHSYIDQARPVLWETRNREGNWIGYTDNFIRVELENNQQQDLENRITLARLTGLTDSSAAMTATSIA